MALGVAILAAEWSADHLLWGVGTIVLLAEICLHLTHRRACARSLLLSVACTMVLGYGFTWWTAIYRPADDISRHLSSSPVTLQGQVLRLAKVGQAKAALDLSARVLIDETTKALVSGRVRVTVYDFEPVVGTGDIVRIHHLRLRRPSGFHNPGAFDYGRYLARRGIYATANLSKGERLELVQRNSNAYLAPLAAFKARLAGRIDRTMSATAAAITREMVLGINGSLAP
jgi:competence protein ComEC